MKDCWHCKGTGFQKDRTDSKVVCSACSGTGNKRVYIEPKEKR